MCLTVLDVVSDKVTVGSGAGTGFGSATGEEVFTVSVAAIVVAAGSFNF